MSFSNQEPLPDAARESLRDRGGRLLGQLESMRQLSDERIPEPSTGILALAGAVFLLGRRQRA